MSHRRVVILLLAAVLGACKSQGEPVAKVNGHTIGKKAFEEAVQRTLVRYQSQGQPLPPGIEQRIRQSVLRRMIDDEIVAQKAKELGVKITDQELNQKFDEHKKKFRTDQAFQEYLNRSKNTEADLKEDMRSNLLRDMVVEKLSGSVEVTDDQIKKYYDESIDRFKDHEQVRASRIFVQVAPNAPAKDKNAAKKKIDDLRKQAVKAGANFAELAQKNSQGPEAPRGGDLGWTTKDRMPKEWDAAVFTLKANDISRVIETPLGYEVVKVWETKPERVRPLTEVQDMIRNALLARERNEKRRDVLRDLKASAKVEQLVTFEPPAAAVPPGATPPTPGAPATPGAPMPPGSPMPQASPGAPVPAAAAPQAPGSPATIPAAPAGPQKP
jgi:peptidyl-prolyl cis-trans isomerase C